MYQKLVDELWAKTAAVASMRRVPTRWYLTPGPIRQLVGADTLMKTGSGVGVGVSLGGEVGDGEVVGLGSVVSSTLIAEGDCSTGARAMPLSDGLSVPVDCSAEFSS